MKTTNRKKYNSFICDFCVYNGVAFEDINVKINFCRKIAPDLDENGNCKDFKEKKSNEEHNRQIELEL